MIGVIIGDVVRGEERVNGHARGFLDRGEQRGDADEMTAVIGYALERALEAAAGRNGGDEHEYLLILHEILHVSDPKYMNRIAARGGESTTNDIVGVWRDIDSGTGLLSVDDVMDFYENSERRDGNMRASADVALTGDMFFIYALDGHHVQDLDAWQGAFSDEIIPFVENFLRRNGVRKENFTFDANGLGLWIAKDSRFTRAVPFNNKSASTDPRLWNNLKSEAAEKFVQGMKNREYSIDPNLLNRTFTDGKGHKFTFKDRFMVERMALKRKDDAPRFEIISKPQMKLEIGHSPDLIEGLMMVSPMFEKQTHAIRRGFDLWQG